MEFINDLKMFSFWGNTGYDYALASIIFIVSIVILKIFQMIILSKLHKLALRTKTDFDDVLIEVFKKIKPPFYFFASVYLSTRVLSIADIVTKVLFFLFVVAIVFEVIQALARLMDYFTRKYIERNKEKDEDTQHAESMARLMQLIVKVVLWFVGIILILSNLGVNVSSLIAGMGIGGIAIALALQTVLGDLFSAFSIYIDKPFKVGDRIQVGTDFGTVEKVGMKTTRIRTLQGEQLIISNQELTNTRVQNYRRMEKRRSKFSLGVLYETPAEKLEAIPKIIEEIIDKNESARFDRCHFVDYGDFSLLFEIVFFVDSGDYGKFLEAKQNINMEIFKRFDKEGIGFAYPTQKIFVDKEV